MKHHGLDHTVLCYLCTSSAKLSALGSGSRLDLLLPLLLRSLDIASSFFAFKSSAWWENRPFHILLVGMNVAQSLEDSLQVSLNYNCPNPWTLSTYAYGKGQILYCLTARD